LGRLDPRLKELGELTKRSASKSFDLSLEFFEGRARWAPEQDLMESGEEGR